MKYATRLNSFLRTHASLYDAFDEIAAIPDVDYVDLNYPEHFHNCSAAEIKAALAARGLACNAVNMRFRDQFLNGEFGNPDAAIAEAAVTLCREACAAAEQVGARQIIVWLGFDGFDYSFQIDYVTYRRRMVAAFKQVCTFTDLPISIEYKPYEERVHAFIDSFGTTLAMLQEIDCDRMGVTLDFCHMLMKKENPASAAAWLLERGLLFNVHLNDGEGSTDDGLMVGTVNFWKTVEMMFYLKKYQFDGVIYFDTFPKREAAAAECRANREMCRLIEDRIDALGLDYIEGIVATQDATRVTDLMMNFVKGAVVV